MRFSSMVTATVSIQFQLLARPNPLKTPTTRPQLEMHLTTATSPLRRHPSIRATHRPGQHHPRKIVPRDRLCPRSRTRPARCKLTAMLILTLTRRTSFLFCSPPMDTPWSTSQAAYILEQRYSQQTLQSSGERAMIRWTTTIRWTRNLCVWFGILWDTKLMMTESKSPVCITS